MEFKDDDNCENNELSPNTDTCFIKSNNNKDKELFYMSPIEKSTSESIILLSTETSNSSLNKDITEFKNIDEFGNFNEFDENNQLKDFNRLNNIDDIININNFINNNFDKNNFLNENLKFLNIIVNKNNSEKDVSEKYSSTKIKDEDRIEEL